MSFTLGQRVAFKDTLRRVTQHKRTPTSVLYRRSWERYGSGVDAPQPGEGILVGLRRLQNGVLIPGDYDTSAYLRIEETFTAALVAVHLRRKPVFVRLEDMEAADE